jgi:hypothetical protein
VLANLDTVVVHVAGHVELYRSDTAWSVAHRDALAADK